MTLDITAPADHARPTVRMKTCELTGKALRFAVAAVEGYDPRNIYGHIVDMFLPHYDSDWSQGGPIAARERISYRYENGMAYHPGGAIGCDADELVAKMRCYVASKRGAEIDVPQEVAQ